MTTEAWRDLVITTAMLLGAPDPIYYDFGHPERAANRKYWRVVNNEPDQLYTLYGHTRADVLYRWLIRQGYTVTKSLEVQKIFSPTE
jgi:hypothetical protein